MSPLRLADRRRSTLSRPIPDVIRFGRRAGCRSPINSASRATSYTLGGKQLGTGPRGRLRFDRERALAAWADQGHGIEHRRGRRTEECASRGRRRRRNATTGCLPVRRGAHAGQTRPGLVTRLQFSREEPCLSIASPRSASEASRARNSRMTVCQRAPQRVYRHGMRRDPAAKARLQTLVGGVDWTAMGTGAQTGALPVVMAVHPSTPIPA